MHRAKHTLCYSPITKAEIYHGLRKGEEERTARLFGELGCLSIDDSVGQKAGEYLNRYRKSHALQLADALIAATAFCETARLFTLNRRHYPMIDIEFYDTPQGN